MSNDYFKRIQVVQLYPQFAQLVAKLHVNCLARGSQYYATSGLRSVEDQDKLYAQGRTTPGDIVTNARGGQSYHNFGIAIDFCLDKDVTREGLQPDWNAEAYKVLAEEAVKLGLEPGYYWKFKDAPHVQLKISKAGLALLDLQKNYKNGGMKQVWSLLDSKNWS